MTARTEPGHCRLCGARGAVLHDGLRDELFGVPGTWRLARCTDRSCRLVWLDAELDGATIASFYADYHTHDDRDVERPAPAHAPRTAVTEGGWSRRRARLRQVWPTPRRRAAIARLEQACLPAGEGRSLLEVGCGAGKNLARLQARGWVVTGQELDPAAAAVATAAVGVPVLVEPITSVGLPGASFDAVVLVHVLEHLDRPDVDLAACARLLRPGGTLVCITPNSDALGHRLFGRRWRGLEPPRHLFLYNPATAARVVRDAGFANVRSWSTSARADRITHDTVDTLTRRLPRGAGFVVSRAAGVAVQLLATVLRADRRGRGEECVVIAER